MRMKISALLGVIVIVFMVVVLRMLSQVDPQVRCVPCDHKNLHEDARHLLDEARRSLSEAQRQRNEVSAKLNQLQVLL